METCRHVAQSHHNLRAPEATSEVPRSDPVRNLVHNLRRGRGGGRGKELTGAPKEDLAI